MTRVIEWICVITNILEYFQELIRRVNKTKLMRGNVNSSLAMHSVYCLVTFILRKIFRADLRANNFLNRNALVLRY